MKENTSILRGALSIPLLLFLALTAIQAQNCEVDGVTEFEWYFGREIPILDTARGVTFEAITTDIQSVAVSSSSTESALNGGPYVEVSYANNLLVVALLDAFELYEEHETLLAIQTDLVFTCTVATRILNIRHVITDTNNHAPQFLPGNQYEFTIFTPTGAGTPLTRLYTEIIVRDIDLTTSSIDFGIESNDMLSISYLQRDSTDPKNFHALLETSSIIMGLDGAVNLQITATDVDGTAGPQITTDGTVILDSDAQSLHLPTTPVFGQSIYTGSYSLTDGLVIEDEISVTDGFDDTITFLLSGDNNEYFSITNNSNVVTIIVSDGIPDEVLYGSTHILLSLRALKDNTVGAWATVAITFPTETILRFQEDLYKGTIEDNELQLSNITISEGYRDGVNFTLTGEYENLFSVSNENNIIHITLTTPLTDDILQVINSISLILGASGQNLVATSTVIILDIIKVDVVHPEFSEPYYTGSYDPATGLLMDSTIVLSQGYDETVNFSLVGDHSQLFSLSNENETVTLSLTSVPETDLEGHTFLLVTLLATKPGASAAAALLHVSLPDANTPGVLFSSAVYEGIYNQGSLSFEPIVVESGYSDEVTFDLAGELATHFNYIDNNGVISITLASDSLPENVVLENTFIHIVLSAMQPSAITTRTVLIITINEQANTSGVIFSSAVYEGIYNQGSLSFEPIVIESGYSDEVTFDLAGELATHFNYIDNNGAISITLASDSLPENVVLENTFIHIVLTAMKPSAITTRTVLIITINELDITETPTVTFQTSSLLITATSSQLGVIGTVSATASNGENIIYSLSIENEHLNERLQIDVYTGQLSLSSYADIGNYNAIVTATTFISRVAVNTTVEINIENVTTCIADDYMLDPLIIISRDEEEAHQGLVTLTSASIGVCNYSITNQYPNIENWFYIDSSGSLSCNSIDREHSSIAFMIQSQIQIELTLTCNGDEDVTRNDTYSNLEPQMYTDIARNEISDVDGRFWILTESIQHNIRRSLVNVIINDINDNDPIFDGKENEPVVIGYPNADIVGVISPPSFATVYATDADIGHNANIMYSTEDNNFAIHPDSGVVYIRDNALDSLSDGDTVRVVATDQYGDGRSTYLDLEVRLLQSEHIVLITVKGAYLEDVNTIVSNLTSVLQHEVRSLSYFVVPETQDAETRARNNPTIGYVEPKVWGHIDPKFLSRDYVLREGETNEATLSIYVYALDAEKTPVYASDIVLLVSENEQAMYWSVVGHSLSETVPVVSVVQVTSTSTSMLVSTIILSVLLVLLILAFIVWYFIIRKNNYKNFTDTSSDSSHRSSLQADFTIKPPSKDVLTTLPPNLSPNNHSPTRIPPSNLSSNNLSPTHIPINNLSPNNLSPTHHIPSNNFSPNNLYPMHLPVTDVSSKNLPPNLSPTRPPPTNLPQTPLYTTTLPPTSLSYPTPYTITFNDTNQQRARTYEKRLDPSKDKVIEEEQKNESFTISNPSIEKDFSSPLSYADETLVGFPSEKLDEVDEDEFGESKLKRRKSVVTFNEHVEKIHVEKIEAEPEIDDELEQEYHRL